VETARCLAEIRGVTAGELERVTEENARRLFGLPPVASLINVTEGGEISGYVAS
jgi:hypothetical protein